VSVRVPYVNVRWGELGFELVWRVDCFARGSLGLGDVSGLLAEGLPLVGEEFVDAPGGMSGEAIEDVAEQNLEDVDLVAFACHGETVEDRGGMAAVV